MPEKFTRFDITEFLLAPADLRNYIKACEEEDLGDGSFNRVALRDVKHTIRARIQNRPSIRSGIKNRSRYTLSKRRG